ncbi:MAG: sulfotransferase [Mariprofundaceae bacterium]|nr:sulfotransferase [Mariprofundaceae bacterium]
MSQNPILIIGMARSGTTPVTHLLGSLPQTHVELEPHMVWKAGSFKHLSDTHVNIQPAMVQWIRQTLLSKAKGKILVEKSPPNCLRPDMIHAVFPEARIVYVQRDQVRCIASNFERSRKSDSLNPKIIFKKYLYQSGTKNLGGALGSRSLRQQLRLTDYLPFLRYATRMLLLRQSQLLPFGPKISNYPDIVSNHGLLEYHVRVWRAAEQSKVKFQQLYGDKMKVFQLEKLFNTHTDLEELYEFCGFQPDKKQCQNILIQLNRNKLDNLKNEAPLDAEIRYKLDKHRKDIT